MKITTLLIIVNFLVFALTLNNPEYYITNYGFSLEKFMRGEYYRIITAIFLHASLTHLFFNSISLFFIGRSVEESVGKLKTFLVFLLSAMIGNFGVIFYSNAIGVGSSGGISGLAGYGVFVCPFRITFTPLPLPFIVFSASFLLFNLYNLFSPSPIAFSVHVLSFLVGAFLGFISVKDRKKKLIIFLIFLALILIFSQLNIIS